MSGHSKWSTIKHKKAAQDSKRGKVFGEIGRMIRVAVKEGKSGDVNQNPSLRVALEKAKTANMPRENVDRAIAKGLGKSATGAMVEEVVYEAYGPGGVAMQVASVTDNRNRTAAEIRSLIERHGGSLAGPGATAYVFEMGNEGRMKVKVPMMGVSERDKTQVDVLVEALEELDDVETVITNIVA
jgi:YebC/PmpR family DNA-binding regulatory protein